MIKAIKQIVTSHKTHWTDSQFLFQVFFHTIFLSFSIFLTYLAVSYTDGYSGGNIVPDLLLDHIPKQDVGLIFFQGSFVFLLSLAGLAILLPEAIPFGLASTALFFMVRAGFMSMTHLSAPFIAHYSYISHKEQIPEVVFSMNSGNDMFFSGHTGFPFLLAMMFWQHRYLKYYFLFCSIIAGVAVILGHLHYSIDVFSAFFISYGIFIVSKKTFKKEYDFFEDRPKTEPAISIKIK